MSAGRAWRQRKGSSAIKQEMSITKLANTIELAKEQEITRQLLLQQQGQHGAATEAEIRCKI